MKAFNGLAAKLTKKLAHVLDLMDDPKVVILDISSDEEEINGGTNGVGADGGSEDYYDWLAKLLDDDKESAGDSDDVVVVGDVISNSKKTVKSSITVSKDSDCVVLEEDPDKS